MHGHARAGLVGIALIVDAPAVLLQRRDAVRVRLVPVMLAGRGDARASSSADLPAGTGAPSRASSSSQAACGFERAAVAGLAASGPGSRRRRAPAVARCRCRPGRESARRRDRRAAASRRNPSRRSPGRRRRAGRAPASVSSSCEIGGNGVRRAACGTVAQPATAQQQAERQQMENRRCMAAADSVRASAGAACSSCVVGIALARLAPAHRARRPCDPARAALRRDAGRLPDR